MNQYLFLRRMRAPIMLLVFGVTAILDEYAGIHYSKSWPLYIIAWGILKLAENAILAQNPPSSLPPYPGSQQPGYAQQPGYSQPGYSGSGTTTTSTAIVPADPEERR